MEREGGKDAVKGHRLGLGRLEEGDAAGGERLVVLQVAVARGGAWHGGRRVVAVSSEGVDGVAGCCAWLEVGSSCW